MAGRIPKLKTKGRISRGECCVQGGLGLGWVMVQKYCKKRLTSRFRRSGGWRRRQRKELREKPGKPIPAQRPAVDRLWVDGRASEESEVWTEEVKDQCKRCYDDDVADAGGEDSTTRTEMRQSCRLEREGRSKSLSLSCS